VKVNFLGTPWGYREVVVAYKIHGRLGSGERFKHLVKSGVSPRLAAWIGRKKFGKKRFQKLAAAGR